VPQFLKAHLLFDYHIQFTLERWETLGGFDEQSIESTHPQFNQLLRRYGATRGQNLKRQVMRQFLMERAFFIMELVEEMIKKTSRKKRPNSKKRGRNGNRNAAFASQPAEDTAHVAQTALSDLEVKMNSNEFLHPVLEKFPLLDARISACRHCAKRLLNFSAAVHYHEYHSCSILDDIDSNVTERLKQEGAL